MLSRVPNLRSTPRSSVVNRSSKGSGRRLNGTRRDPGPVFRAFLLRKVSEAHRVLDPTSGRPKYQDNVSESSDWLAKRFTWPPRPRKIFLYKRSLNVDASGTAT